MSIRRTARPLTVSSELPAPAIDSNPHIRRKHVFDPQRRGNAIRAAAVFVSLRASSRMSFAAGRAWQAARKSDCPSRGINKPPAVASAIMRSGAGRFARLRSLPYESDFSGRAGCPNAA
jgi:hypothetical protein